MYKKIMLLYALIVTALSVDAARVYRVPTVNLPGGEGLVNVALPADYDTLCSYPTLYLLNGYGGNHLTWGNIIDIDSLATASSMVIVCPAGLDSWYWDSPVDSTMCMESYIIDDLVPWVDSRFCTIREREARAITGLSMGGHGGLWLAMRHQDVFGNAGSTSGGVDFTPWHDSWRIPERLGRYDEDVWRRYTVMYIAQGLEPGSLNIIMDCGTEDFFFDVNNALDSLLTSRGVAHTYLTSPGEHNSAYWHRSIVPQVDFFRKNMPEVRRQ